MTYLMPINMWLLQISQRTHL